MEAEHAWYLHRLFRYLRKRSKPGWMIRDQGRQHSRGAKEPVRRRNTPDAVKGRIIVQERIAAAIDLQVDKARRQNERFRKANDHVGIERTPSLQDGDNAAIRNFNTAGPHKPFAVENAACLDGK
jgi:hypothetical protein